MDRVSCVAFDVNIVVEFCNIFDENGSRDPKDNLEDRSGYDFYEKDGSLVQSDVCVCVL